MKRDDSMMNTGLQNGARARARKGTTLIEVLTVIVIFLVGILVLLQAFPTGLQQLRTTRSNLLASTLARAEMQRLQSAGTALPEMIAPVRFLGTGSVAQVIGNQDWNDLNPTADGIDSSGRALVAGSPIGRWDEVSGANHFSRIIGELRTIPAGSTVSGSGEGIRFQPTFTPIYYERDAATGVGLTGGLVVYTNDLVRAISDPDLLVNRRIRPGDSFRAFVVPGEDAAGSPAFDGAPQLWVPLDLDDSLQPIVPRLRLTYSWRGTDPLTGASESSAIILVDPATVTATQAVVLQAPASFRPYLVINLREIASVQGFYGDAGISPATIANVLPESVRVQKVLSELPAATAFSPTNPLEYRVLNDELGLIMVNPLAAGIRLDLPGGRVSPLQVRMDYSVLDWRILREALRAPATGGATLRLSMSSLEPLSSTRPDGTASAGLTVPAPVPGGTGV
ncbi:MAG: hypothetical protein MH204_00660, partial [Fimbriimonadaceae bacterium]|nr:hypothetical protein [Fimbriimonadaceae bacterium]